MDGYHPTVSCIGQEGYLLNCELREAKQHCEKGTPTYLEHILSLAGNLRCEVPVLVWLDAGHDAQETLRVLYTTLRYLGQPSLELEAPCKPRGFRKRLRKVIDDPVRVAVKIVPHARTIYLKLWAMDPWLPCFKQLYYLCCNL